jgi:hypothetical protein
MLVLMLGGPLEEAMERAFGREPESTDATRRDDELL